MPVDEVLDLAVGAKELLGLLDDVLDVEAFDALLRSDQRRTPTLLYLAAFTEHPLGNGFPLELANLVALQVVLMVDIGNFLLETGNLC
jgi:hypothetical protein